MYAFVGKTTNKALVILKVMDSQNAVNYLKEGGIEVLSPDVVYGL
jgi:hypothetical protein